MYDNKIRLSPDVMEKAEQIASEWGLKNVRAAVEAVFRRYADDYLHGHGGRSPDPHAYPPAGQALPPKTPSLRSNCEALNELDDLLGL